MAFRFNIDIELSFCSLFIELWVQLGALIIFVPTYDTTLLAYAALIFGLVFSTWDKDGQYDMQSSGIG